MQTFLLFLPLVFTFGLLPQINTFLLSLLEQIEIYLFGGTAQHSLASAFLNVSRSAFSILALALILFISVYSSPMTISEISGGGGGTSSGSSTSGNSHLADWAHTAAKHNQYSHTVLFSVYCACIIIVGYMLSRQTSDTLTLFKAFFANFIQSFRRKTAKKQKSTTPATGDESNKNLKGKFLFQNKTS